jgi:hypothetical protein
MSATYEAALDSRTHYHGRALELLNKTLEHDVRRCRSFLEVLRDPDTRKAAADKEVFSTLVNYAINGGFVDQTTLAEVTHYEKSQIGRWKNGQAAPPLLARLAVLDNLTALLEDAHSRMAAACETQKAA